MAAIVLPCLSLSQPWAAMVLSPEIDKSIENRVWNCHKRGPFLIHAAKGMTDRGYRHAFEFAERALGKLGRYHVIGHVPPPQNLKRGGIVGAGMILDVVHPNRMRQIGTGNERHSQADNPWLMDGCYGFVLGQRVRLPFRPYPGRQRWFNVELLDSEVDVLVAAGLLDRTRIRMRSVEVEYEGSAEGAKRVMGAVGKLIRGGR